MEGEEGYPGAEQRQQTARFGSEFIASMIQSFQKQENTEKITNKQTTNDTNKATGTSTGHHRHDSHSHHHSNQNQASPVKNLSSNSSKGEQLNQQQSQPSGKKSKPSAPLSAAAQSKNHLLSLGIEEKYIIPGERFVSSINTTLKHLTSRIEGVLCLTNFKLIFRCDGDRKKMEENGPDDFYQIDLMMIQSCERTVERKGNQYSYIDIDCKDVRKIQYRFTLEQSEDSFQFTTLIVENAFFKEIHKYPAFAYRRTNDLEDTYHGWQVLDLRKEYTRMQLPAADQLNSHQVGKQTSNFKQFCLLSLSLDILIPSSSLHTDSFPNHQNLYKYLDNSQKEYCETYPPLIVVPFGMSEEDIKKCAKFRSRERLPALTFSMQVSGSHVTMWRCSQCKTGLGNRSSEDELMLKLIGDPLNKGLTANNINNGLNVHIYDARPFMNAIGNKIAGKGYENTNCYKNCEIFFLEIHNIHKVRDAYNKMVSACLSLDHTKWYRDIDQSTWLDFIAMILSGTERICQSMQKGIHVVIHCSDGWDRTSQLVALAQLCLDPYYRTIKGFQVLIEKDWVYFGHQFNLRQGHGTRNQNDETSPVFLQFLDCVHQLLRQYPLSFEFNEQFLVDLAFSSYNCLFGTFLRNFYQEQIFQNKIRNETISVWSWMNSRLNLYTNPFFQPDSTLTILKPQYQQRSLRVWKRFFLYYSSSQLDQYNLHQSCRFNIDNIEENERQTKDKLKEFENFFLGLNLKIPKDRNDFALMTGHFQGLLQQQTTNDKQESLTDQDDFEVISNSSNDSVKK